MQSPSSTDTPGLDDLLCFAVYSAGLAVNRVYRPQLERLGLTYPQFLAMVALWEEDGASVGRLGEKLSLDSSTLTPLLKRLEAMELVTRRRAAEDERRVLVSLTDKGKALHAEMPAVLQCLSQAAGMPLAELARLTREIRTLRRNLDAYADSQARARPSGAA